MVATSTSEQQILRILHFNDVYDITPQVYRPLAELIGSDPEGTTNKTSGSTDDLKPTASEPHNRRPTIDVTHFAGLFSEVQNKWPDPKDGLVLFSGDVFNPSIESAITRGSHMVPVINQLKVDAAVIGNHEFDHGWDQLRALATTSNYPWIISNITDSTTNEASRPLIPFTVLERAGIKLGIIGLVEKQWYDTIAKDRLPENSQYEDMATVAKRLSASLREEHGCEIIIALTHSGVEEDIQLAKALGAHKDRFEDVLDEHGVDLVLGGHDHDYYVGKGVDAWVNLEGGKAEGTLYVPGTGKLEARSTEDDGVRMIKSGTDFHEFSEITLVIEKRLGKARRKVITSIKGIRHEVTPHVTPCPTMAKLYDRIASALKIKTNEPLCYSLNAWDVRNVRQEETPFGNWLADLIFLEFLQIALDGPVSGLERYPHGVLLASGSLRGSTKFGPGEITTRYLNTILQYPDPVHVIKVTGKELRAALENGLGRGGSGASFPIISGFQVKWSPARPAYDRITSLKYEGEEVKDDDDYRIVTQEFITKGRGGYTVLMKDPLDKDSGLLPINIVLKYFLGLTAVQNQNDLLEYFKKQKTRLASPASFAPASFAPASLAASFAPGLFASAALFAPALSAPAPVSFAPASFASDSESSRREGMGEALRRGGKVPVNEFEELLMGLTADAPTTEAPTTEASTAEASTAEASTAEASTAEASTAEASTAEASTAEASTAEASTAEASTAEASTADAPTAEASTADAPTADASTADASTADAPTPPLMKMASAPRKNAPLKREETEDELGVEEEDKVIQELKGLMDEIMVIVERQATDALRSGEDPNDVKRDIDITMDWLGAMIEGQMSEKAPIKLFSLPQIDGRLRQI
ncbi:hypothetical protein BOTBODRAFT_187919 [Botryobasidium botryosum FD-172 SS1]|uniref:5'-Nucleotidase C-terminal domain-containing protein n=1 Tax=Botryobasidium botryosum (strain FD-172 SS1) TaxID=930990 RepID=A0A067MQX5_BOTB1|nr:hypothetical protein BOTBODRAFT_187919 [Botryobasidium botryosum FD-172 SS1]